MSRFVDRDSELLSLEEQYNRNESSLVIIYGRRRIGKTTLISSFLTNHNDSIYFLCTEEAEEQNFKYFRNQVGSYTGNELLKNISCDWYTIFKNIIDYKTEDKKIIVIDEFQYIGKSYPAFPSVIQKIWDTILKDANIMLILCGSLVSLMRSQTLDYSSPLYGRRTGQIRLRQIPFRYYGEFYNNRKELDLIPFYAVTGGVPKYVEAFTKYNDIYEAIKCEVLNSQSFLYEEPYFLLQKEVNEIGSYFSLIRAIAFGNHKLSEIATFIGCKQTSLTKYLKVLTDLDLISREVPVTEKYPEKSKSGLYHITDNFIAFWFKFVYPYKGYLEQKEINYVLEQIKKEFVQNHVSFIYEDVCREKMWDLANDGTWTFRFDRVGRYWGPKIKETDIVAIDSIGNNIIVGECKYSRNKKGLDVFNDLLENGKKLKEITNSKHIEYVIFSSGGYSDSLLEEEKKRDNLKLFKF